MSNNDTGVQSEIDYRKPCRTKHNFFNKSLVKKNKTDRKELVDEEA